MRALPDIKQQLAGKFQSALIHIGIPETVFNGKHQGCIMHCQCGKDRARWVSAYEGYLCNQCGWSSPIDMAMVWWNLPYKETVRDLRIIMGENKLEEVKVNDYSDKNQARLDGIRLGIKRIAPDNVAGRYFAKRGITVLPEKSCVYHPSLKYWATDSITKKPISLGEFPCVVSVFRNNEGKECSYHLTFLDQEGNKLNIEHEGAVVPVKKILPAVLPLAGSAIRLFDATDTVCIVEGLESGLSVYQDSGLPVWVAGNTNQMAKMVIPDEIKHIYIYEDADISFAGRLAASQLANRLAMKGDRETIKIISLVDTQQVIVSQEKYDMNDYVVLNTDH